jgi:hypothetical protein
MNGEKHTIKNLQILKMSGLNVSFAVKLSTDHRRTLGIANIFSVLLDAVINTIDKSSYVQLVESILAARNPGLKELCRSVLKNAC